jgi:hypothetical protein
MAKAWERAARAADAIAASRRRRRELATLIETATKRRRGEVRSWLAIVHDSRRRGGGEQAAELQKTTRARRVEVRATLKRLNAARRRLAREYFSEAKTAKDARKAKSGAQMTSLFDARAAGERRRRELVATMRRRAAAFMRDLTGGVAALRNGFAAKERDRAVGVRERLVAYAFERRNAEAARRKSADQARGVGAETSATTAPAAANVVKLTPNPSPESIAVDAEARAAPLADSLERSTR